MTTEFSDAQIIPLSKRFDNSKSETARSTLAVLSTYTAPFPAPTPIDGFPECNAALTIDGPPVAKIDAIFGFLINAFVASIDGVSIH